MKHGVAAIVIIALVACSGALPAKKRMVYYNQPAQFYGAPQRMMYVQYVQPAKTHARSTQGAEALVAGDAVATGTYLNDCDTAEGADQDVLAAAGAHGAQSVAEAYPAESTNTQVQVEIEQTNDEPAVDGQSQGESDDEAKVPREYNFESETSVAADAAAPATGEEPVAAEEPAVVADVPAPAKRVFSAKKKVIVELEQPAADEETDSAAAVADEETAAGATAEDDAQEEEAPAAPVVARRPALRKPAKPARASGKPTKPVKPLPAGTFFPIDFGGTNGGAIAIANAFSTGEGGSATSHAIAYGSPDAVRARARPSKYH